VRLVERAHPDWPLERVIRARFDPSLRADQARELSDVPAMSESWRAAFRKKQARGFKEDTSARLMG